MRQAAEESFVLLKNEKVADGAPILPLAAGKKIALVGPLGDDAGVMVGAWGGAGATKDTITLKQALDERAQIAQIPCSCRQ